MGVVPGELTAGRGGRYAATHGTHDAHDRTVSLLVVGPAIPPGILDREVHPDALADAVARSRAGEVLRPFLRGKGRASLRWKSRRLRVHNPAVKAHGLPEDAKHVPDWLGYGRL